MSLDLTDDMSTLVQVMAWCRHDYGYDNMGRIHMQNHKMKEISYVHTVMRWQQFQDITNGANIMLSIMISLTVKKSRAFIT